MNMDNGTEPVPESTLEDIKKNFGFLFERGYEVVSGNILNRRFAAWTVMLRHHDFHVKFYGEKGGLNLSFGSPEKGFAGIHSLVYYLSEEKVFSRTQGKKKEARFLQEHLDEFELCYGDDFLKHQGALKDAEQRYSEKLKQVMGIKKVYNASSGNQIKDKVRLFAIFLVYFLVITFALPLFGFQFDFNIQFFVSVALAFLTDYLLSKRRQSL